MVAEVSELLFDPEEVQITASLGKRNTTLLIADFAFSWFFSYHCRKTDLYDLKYLFSEYGAGPSDACIS